MMKLKDLNLVEQHNQQLEELEKLKNAILQLRGTSDNTVVIESGGLRATFSKFDFGSILASMIGEIGAMKKNLKRSLEELGVEP